MARVITDEQLTNYLLQFCYTCERGHECTTEEMTVACMKEKQEQAACEQEKPIDV